MPKLSTTPTSREFFIKKIRHVCDWLKRKRGFRSYFEISRYAGERPRFLYNVLYNPTARYAAGPPFDRFHAFCRAHDLDPEYFANPEIPVRSNFLASGGTNIFKLQTEYKASGNPRFFHMVAGLVHGSLSDVCGCTLLQRENRALISIFSGKETGVTYIMDTDKNNRFFISKTWDDPKNATGRSLLTDNMLERLCENLKPNQ